ncbi:hypothetical protein E4T44_06926 [Aureobasidium sp. EXF-8845]|nr:hypothetical protein E4T44_06926 [Aureobasidium sp. EXF-8845]KAI4847172.1 hypothetical protein E4T45_06891 [Aureobasidium sp. EXF-8846]
MPPKSTLSARDIEVVAAAFQCLKTPPDIDWDKLAEKAGYKNGPSARACFQDIKKRLRSTAGDETATPATNTNNRKPTVPRKRKQPQSPSSSSATLTSSSPTADSDNETNAPPTKKPRITKATKAKSTTASKVTRAKKQPAISTPETEEDINNAKAIAAGRARYAADKLAAEIKMEEQDERDYSVVGAEERDDAEDDAEPMGMNIDEGEDEGPTAYDLVKNEVFGEGVEI